MTSNDERNLLAAIELARRSRERGNHPFGALLADSGGNVLLEAENSVVTGQDPIGHAETNLLREACARFDPLLLTTCTMYTSTEPCAMCAAAAYWCGLHRVVFALSHEQLSAIAGKTLELSCREVFARGSKEIEVSGPHLEEQARPVHEDFWD